MLVSYGASDSEDDSDGDVAPGSLSHIKSAIPPVNSAPVVIDSSADARMKGVAVVAKDSGELVYNPTAEELFAPESGPRNPFKSNSQMARKNTLGGHAEVVHVSDFNFDNQQRTFQIMGYAVDPSDDACGSAIVGDTDAFQAASGSTLAEASTSLVNPEKRKKKRNMDAGDVQGFTGPWAKYEGEKEVAVPDEEDKAWLDDYNSKRQKNKQSRIDGQEGRDGEEKQERELKNTEERSTLHVTQPTDYQGRSFLEPPHNVGVNLKSEYPPERCFLPKRLLHTYKGHSKGVQVVRLFPGSGHLFLSGSMDSRIKLWECYDERRLIRSYAGHGLGVRDLCFQNDGTKFISASYDRWIKLWDTETGQCVQRMTTRRVPYCVRFNPDPGRQHFFLAGQQDKKVVCWDIRSSHVVQEYDRHLGAINTVTFIDKNRRFVTTSDDKTIRVWEWNIPVDFKYLADPSMHAIPATAVSPGGKFMACQSMDNKVTVYNVLANFRQMRKKVFKGHLVAGYACGVEFSPDMSYLASGDAEGKVFIWDWKTTKTYAKWKAHDGVCMSVQWLPHETSKILTAGWDGNVHLWD